MLHIIRFPCSRGTLWCLSQASISILSGVIGQSRICKLGWATFDFLSQILMDTGFFPCSQACWFWWCSSKLISTWFRDHEKSLKMAVFLIFDLKWDIIAHSTLTSEGKQAAMNGMNRTCIQLSFDTTFIPVSLMIKWVFPPLKNCLQWPTGGWVWIPPTSVFLSRKG